MENFTLSWLARCRWNVLDMISVIGRGTVPTCLLYEIDMSWAEALRAKLNSLGYRTTVTAILLKAIAIAQRAHPLTRTVLLPFGRTAVFHKIVAGFTVERVVDNHFAVFFGAIDDPDRKPLTEIANELKAYGEDEIQSVPQLAIEDRFNKMPWLFRRVILWIGLRHPEVRLHYMGATFGLSSLGRHGCKLLIPPCVSTSTFGVGEVEEKPVVVDGKIEIRPVMSLVLNFDHRVIDGAPAARFMQEVTALIQGGLEEHVREELEKIALNQSQPIAVS
jgi:pyruvate/2-oxoglutarate dehydrogenase complex dihydrolipoamide acyltransferase (E2) component